LTIPLLLRCDHREERAHRMSVLEGRTHQGRIAAGDSLLEAAATRDTVKVKARLAGFAAAHRALTKAQAALDDAEATLSARRVAVAERDLDQDQLVDRVASALVGDGLPRRNPFAPLSPLTATKLKDLGYGAEAAAFLALIARARKRKDLSPRTLTTLGAAEKAATAVRSVLTAVAPAQAKVDRARTRRDALVQPWETAFAALKRGARAAEDDGATGHYSALFVSTAPAKKPAKKKPAPVT
jgi:hypothetical protein